MFEIDRQFLSFDGGYDAISEFLVKDALAQRVAADSLGVDHLVAALGGLGHGALPGAGLQALPAGGVVDIGLRRPFLASPHRVLSGSGPSGLPASPQEDCAAQRADRGSHANSHCQAKIGPGQRDGKRHENRRREKGREGVDPALKATCATLALILRREQRGSKMIMRVFQVVIRPGKEREFSKFFHETAIPLMQSTDGCVQVLPGAARDDTPREFCFVMVWRDLQALKAFVGENYTSPHIAPDEAELVESRTIKHYDLVEV